ncbi:MAG: alpha/beta hydrolase [Desulfotignum sp.]|nr:alpha/beta hydrolase [Desulfotignum sp.]MCF8137056.1 alpha/beta hydrolase [Desulfotignum sp.]
MKEFNKAVLPLTIEGTELRLSVISRTGKMDPILFLHGFGSTKEDYADITRQNTFKDYPFLAYDAPGCGESYCSDLNQVSIPFLVQTAVKFLAYNDIRRFHLVGHSMGGLTALLLANMMPDKVLSFTNIEGNIAPEDCFLSRQIIEHPAPSAKAFFDEFIERTLNTPAYSSPLYSASLKQKVRAEAVNGIFSSMVDLSDNGDLMNKFLDLSCPKMFMYGEQNRHLSYLDFIESKGVRLSEIPECGHFPMYSNPPEMWRELFDFIS